MGKESQDKPVTREPDAARQEELRTKYQKESETSYKGIAIRTLGELHWIMRERNWSGEAFLPKGAERANVSEAYLDNVNLSGADLYMVDFTGASLIKANLSDAKLFYANLSHALIYQANLSGAYLGGANVNSANFGISI